MTSNPSCAQFKHSNMNSRPGRRRDDTLPETRSLISGRKHRERCDAQLDELQVGSLVKISWPSIHSIYLQALEKELTNFQRVCQTYTEISLIYHFILICLPPDIANGIFISWGRKQAWRATDTPGGSEAVVPPPLL